MKLQILVPQYNEDEDVIYALLNSISIQQNINFDDIGVIICNDGSDVILSDKFLNAYTFQIQYYKKSHKGVSATRNFCLKQATADYVMFCDADDKFYGDLAIFRILNYINEGFDSLRSFFIQEMCDNVNDTVRIAYRVDEHQFIHGRVYNREFLIKNNLFWKENMIYGEDYYYSKLCTAVSKNKVICPYFIYYQQFRGDSITHKESNSFINHYTDVINAQDELLMELLKRELLSDAFIAVTIMIIDTYFIVNFMDTQNIISIQKIQIIFQKYKELWNNVPLYDKITYFNNSIQQNKIKYKDFKNWLNQIFDFL